MDGSLASLFIDGSTPLLPISWASGGQSAEELQFELARTSMELETAKSEALAQEKLQEARLFRLQELLNTTRMERDKAREECQKLQERLRHASLSPADSPCSHFHSISSSPSSGTPSSPSPLPDLHCWKMQEITPQSPPLSLPPPMSEGDELRKAGLATMPLSQGREAEDLHDLFNLETNKDTIVACDSSQQFSMDVLDEDLLIDQDQSLELENLQEAFPAVLEGKSTCNPGSGRTLSRQSSSNSSSASVAQQFQVLDQSPEVSAPISSPVAAVSSPSDTMSDVVTRTCQSVFRSTSVAPVVRGVETSPRSTIPLKRVHLPEPPEADPQVMLGSLPEKGKLLQAVMQAGPLLQTLLLAGPLPQWRHPPPALSTFEIPKVSMSNSVLFPFVAPSPPTFVPNQTQMFVSGHGMSSPGTLHSAPIYVRGGTAVRPDSMLAEDRTLIPCSRSRKLRKLNSATLYSDQMMSGGVKLAAGSPNLATAW